MIKILTIGNSFSRNATTYLEAMAEASGVELILGKANLGGCSLEKHWNLVEQCRQLEGLREVRPYDLYVSGRETLPATLREALCAEAWDYVTMQQVSAQSWRYESYHPYFGLLLELVRELAPQAEPVIHQTWAYRVDAPFFAEHGISQAIMYERLKENYEAISRKYGLAILPSGEAFTKAREMLGFVPDGGFDYDNPPLLELPNQERSIIVGHFWRCGNTASGKAELGADYIHANAKGCYLAGAVWYEMLTGKSIHDNSFEPEGIDAETLKLLRQVAHDTAASYGRVINKK